MMRPVHAIMLFLFSIALGISGCRNMPLDVDISEIDLNIELERFDRDLFEMDQNNMDAGISNMYSKYGDFFDVFNVHVINIGLASSRRYSSYLSMFINDPLNREVYEYTNSIFSTTADIESHLSN